MKIVITGIGTDVGKTVVSSIVAEALGATYWKPVQAGDLSNSDTIKVNAFTSTDVQVLEEAYKLKTPASPHWAAELDALEIQDISLPEVTGPLVVEGAGGWLVPFNAAGKVFADFVVDWKLPVSLVSRHYLGSINHTLLSIESILSRGVKIVGIIYVGDENAPTESIIYQKFGIPMLARIPIAEQVNAEFVREQANAIKHQGFIDTLKNELDRT